MRAEFNLFLFLVNIMMGVGIFVNTVPLYNLLGSISFLSYFLTGILVFPIIFISYELSRMREGRDLFEIYDHYFPSLSFVISFAYSFSKYATTVLTVLFLSKSLCSLFSARSSVLYYSLVLLFFLFCYFFTYFDVSISPSVSKGIIFFKIFPIISVVVALFIFCMKSGDRTPSFDFCFFPDGGFLGKDILKGMSITVFSFAGFEALLPVTRSFLSIKKRIPYVLCLTFLFSFSVYFLYQFSVSNLALFLGITKNVHCDFSLFLEDIFSYFFCFNKIYFSLILFSAIISSFGVAHGILFAVTQNITSCFQARGVGRLCAKKIVFLIFPIYLFMGLKNIFILHQLSSLGTIATYGWLIICYGKEKKANIFLFLLSVGSVLMLLLFHLYAAVYYFGFTGYLIYISILAGLFLVKNKVCN